MHEDCINCQEIASNCDEKMRAALLIAFKAERWNYTSFITGNVIERLQICKGMGVTKKTATDLVKKGAQWSNTGMAHGEWRIVLANNLDFYAAHLAVGEAIRDQ